MLCYEAAKEWLTSGSLTRWQSHAITVSVAATLATIISLFVRRWARQIEAVLQRTAEDLHSAQAFNNEVLSVSPVAILAYRHDGQCVMANPAASKLVGTTQSDLLAQNFRELDSWRASGLRDAAENVLSGKGPQRLEVHMMSTFQREVWATAQLIGFDNAGQSHVLLIVQDISEIKRALEEISKREREFHSLADNLPDNIIRIDCAGRALYINQTLERALARPVAEMLGRTAAENYPDGRFDELDKAMRQAGCSGNNSDIELVVSGRDGKPQFHQVRIVAELGEHGAPVSVLAIGRDMTAQKAVEEELRLSASVFHNSAEGVLVTDATSTIISVNPAFTAITGYSEDEAIGKKPSLLRSDRHDAAFYQAMWHTLLIEGHWQGEIWNRRKTGEAYLEWLTINRIADGAGVPVRYVAVFHDITDLRSKDERIRHLAFHDALTGLPNRTLFQERLQHAIQRSRREERKLSVTFIDLDGFKNVNDTLGHDVGDLLLQEAAKRISNRLRRGVDTVARLGGDEFVVLMEDLKESEHSACLAEEIIGDLSLPVDIKDHVVRISASMGVSFFPEDGDSAQELMKHADTAMYAAKVAGKGTYRFFRSEMLEEVSKRLTLEEELRRAIDNHELVLYYQPKVRMADGLIQGVEALVRWQHPARGLVSPTDFIPLAEETGLILPLGNWVLEAACQQAADWHAKGLAIPIAVNVSARQITKGDLPERIGNLLSQYGIPATMLQIELTETDLMADGLSAIETLERLRDMGIFIAVDDFGTGYSSLSRLRLLPIDLIKIDRSFVMAADRNEKDAQVVQMIVALAQTLGLEIVAEGVESEQQAELLQTSGCTVCQGHYYAKAQPAAFVEAMLSRDSKVDPYRQ